MKKIYMLILGFMVVSLSMTLVVRADIATYYNLNITEGYKYNLTTGAYEADQGFATTNKILLRSTTLRISSDTFTYLYLYNSANEYLGFYDTQYANDVVDGLPLYLGEIGTGAVLLPAGTSNIAIAVKIAEHNMYIDTPLTTLNNRSLRYVFESYDMLTSYYEVDDYYESIVADYFNLDFDDYRHIEVINEGGEWQVNFLFETDDPTNNFYINISYQILNTSYGYNYLYITDRDTNRTQIATIGEAGNNYITFTDILTMPYSSLDPYWLEFYIAVSDPLLFNIKTHESVIIDLDMLNLNALSESEITGYLDLFVAGKPYDSLYVLGLGSFDLIQPYYLGEDIPEDEDFSPEALLDRLLDKMGMNNPLAKTVIAIAVILITVVILAIKKIPLMIIMSIAFMEYVLFTYLGWVEGWINIVFGIIIIVLAFMKLRGGNRGND